MTYASRRIVQPESMRRQITDDLRQRLQEMGFAPGDRLVDTEIAREYGTSRMPAREALLALTSQGFLRQTSRGFAVPVLSLDEMRDIFEVRRLIEPPAAADAATRLTPADIARLERARDRARRACAEGDSKELMLANMAFRGAWIDALRNKRLRALIDGFVAHAQTVRIATLRDVALCEVVMAGIETQFAAFARRDAAAAHDALRAFLGRAEAEYFRLCPGAGDAS